MITGKILNVFFIASFESFLPVSLTEKPCSSSTMSSAPSHMVSRCFNCAERGHMSRQCPKPQSLMCYNCQESGHITNTCPIGKYCHACGDSNHLISVCPVRGPVCYKCGINGHLARQCATDNQETKMSLISVLSETENGIKLRCCFACGQCSHSELCCQLGRSH